MKKAQYINFPIPFLKGFMENHSECLNNALDYAIYSHAYEKLEADPISAFKSAAKYFSVKLGNTNHSFENGKYLYENTSNKHSKVGLNLKIFWNYYQKDKTEFELACLLGFLALKSIIGEKSFAKANNLIWLSRMDGETSTVKNESELSEIIKKYSIRHHSDKIKTELQDNWGLRYYSRYTRGFFFSFDLELDQLIYEAEKRRKSTIHKQREFEKKVALDRAMIKLNNL